jgi:hypothetical protein
MDALLGKVGVSNVEDEGSLQDILRFDGVADIYNIGLRIDAQYDALHNSNVDIIQTKVSGQRYHGCHLGLGTSLDN